MEHEDQVLVRVVIELLAPVPHAPLRAQLAPAEGGRRVVRQPVVLTSGDRPVARGTAFRMRLAGLRQPRRGRARRAPHGSGARAHVDTPARLVVSDGPATPLEETIAACDNATGSSSRFSKGVASS